LLDRSIKFKHRRLTLLRLKDAVEMGAIVSVEQLIYCEGVLALMHDSALRRNFDRAVTCARETAATRRDAEIATVEHL
jgi:hypothetical protein